MYTEDNVPPDWQRGTGWYLLALLAYLIWGCGAPAPETSRTGAAPVDPAANAEVWAFEAAWGHQLTGVSLGFTDVQVLAADPDVVGLCVEDGAAREVWLDSQYWLDHPECRESLVFHELGHCALGRGHDDSVEDTGRPLSVMATKITKVCWAWPHYRHDYVEELFQ